ncbi:MAG: hypothetical protein K2J26_06155, partial [Ruminococcus sp.]|nr:hypothetical protein [Ruminococcus sp.]
SLYCYTGGNAICGKIFGEELLQKVKRSEFSHRSNFYPADITKIAYELLNADASKLKSLLIAHTTKNLENELPYLIFIASELSKDINKSDVSLRSIFEFFSHKDNEEIETAIKVLIARGIIKTATKNNRFAFTTLFYYDFFKVLAPESVIQKLNVLETADAASVDSKTWQEQVIEILKSQPSVKRGDFVNIIDALGDEGLSRGIGDALGQGQTVNIGHNNGPVSGPQIIQINVQNITNTLNGILTANGDPQKILSGLRDLPRLNAYLPPRSPEGTDISDAKLSYAIDGYAADMEESLQTAVDKNETELPAVWDILRISEEEFNAFHQKYNIPSCFIDSLRLAGQLEKMFTNGIIGSDLSSLDYSPVSIMYCKLIESMLKEYHTDTYSQALAGIETDLRKDARHKYTWGAIQRLPQSQKQKLTIGSFAFPINVSHSNSSSDTTSNISDLANSSFGSASDWRLHATFIAKIRDIRNPSAHGNMGHQITLADLQQLIKELFDDKGFMRLIELVREPIE